MSLIKDVLRQTSAYLSVYPDEAGRLAAFIAQANADPSAILSRKTMEGHITASAFIINPERNSALLIHHLSLDQWLQPGGHYEGDLSLQDAAQREAQEETGVSKLRLLPIRGMLDIPLDIDTHHIPARLKKEEGEHRHHDFTFLFQALNTEIPHVQASEVIGAKYVPFSEVAALPNSRMQILARKALALLEGIR